MFAFAVVLPAIAIGISNKHVFAAAFPIATIGLIVTVGICLISTYFSGNAAPKTRRYAMFHDLVIALILCVNFLFHFQVSREVSAAEDARTASEKAGRVEQENLDRETQRKLAMAGAQKELLEAEAAAAREQRRVLVQLPPSQRRLAQKPTTQPQPETTTTPGFSTVANTRQDVEQATVISTPEQIRASWFGWLFWAAAAEIFAAILGGMILMMVWQWDVDGDGVADHLQSRQVGFSASLHTPVSAASRPNVSGNFYSPSGPKNPPRP
jgi:hypothetical protein